MQVGKEVESVVQLQVTVAAIYVRHVVAVTYNGQRVDRAIDIP